LEATRVTVGLGARITRKGKASHGGHGGHGGGSELGGKLLSGRSAWVRESRERGKASHKVARRSQRGGSELVGGRLLSGRSGWVRESRKRGKACAAFLFAPDSRPQAAAFNQSATAQTAELSFDAHGFIAIAFPTLFLVRWLSGRKRRFAKALYPKRVPRVRIPASPFYSAPTDPQIRVLSSTAAPDNGLHPRLCIRIQVRGIDFNLDYYSENIWESAGKLEGHASILAAILVPLTNPMHRLLNPLVCNFGGLT
jgi:hypothetical protein